MFKRAKKKLNFHNNLKTAVVSQELDNLNFFKLKTNFYNILELVFKDKLYQQFVVIVHETIGIIWQRFGFEQNGKSWQKSCQSCEVKLIICYKRLF